MRNAMWVGGGITGMGEIPILGVPVKGLTAIIRKIFHSGAQGFAYDPNDLTAEKINWRRNLFTETEFRNGVTDAPLRGGAVSNTSLTGFESAILIEHGGAVNTYAFKGVGITGIKTLSFYVQMTDLSKPVLSTTSADTAGDFMFIYNGNGVAPARVNIEELPNNIYRLSASAGADGNGTYGIIKYSSNTQKSFKMSGFQLEAGSTLSPYQAITNFHTEFLRQFPLHTLYQDAAGSVPVTAAGQPVGLLLDKSKGLDVGANIYNDATTSIRGGGTQKITDSTYNLISSDGSFSSVDIFGGTRFAYYELDFEITRVGSGSLYVGVTNNVFSTAGRRVIKVFSTLDSLGKTGLIQISRVGSCDIDFKIHSLKKIAGNHAYQTTSASRPILQQSSTLGNELVVNGDFSNGLLNWVQQGTAVSSVSEGVLRINGQGSTSGVYQDIPTVVGRTYELNFRSTGLITLLPYANAGFSPSIPNASAPRSTFVATSSVTRLYAYTNGTNTGTIDNISLKHLTGYRTDQNYLAFDGSDDFLQTANIDFTATDKVSLFAGVGKLSDLSSGTVAELGESTMTVNGSFGLFTPNVGNDVTSFLKGSEARTTLALVGYSSPVFVLATAKFDISGNNKQYLKVNSEVTTSKRSTGSGSLGNYPLYIGRRGGVVYPLRGHIYGLIGIGRLTTDSETRAIEKELAKRVGASLNV